MNIYIHNSTALNPTLYQFCIKKHSVSNSVPPTGNVWKLQILEPQWINIRLSLELHFEIQIEWQFIGTFFSWWWWWWISLLGHAFHPTSIGLAVPHICTVCIWISCLRQQFSNNDTCLNLFFCKSKRHNLEIVTGNKCGVKILCKISSVQFVLGSVASISSLQIMTCAFKKLSNTGVTNGKM